MHKNPQKLALHAYFLKTFAEGMDHIFKNGSYILSHTFLFLDPCKTNPCQNGGTCSSDGAGSFKCQCESKYEGQHCETTKGKSLQITGYP